ncbi:hypothetical protein F511_26371 [Dorcoceras hygrometricum]|uniref:Uncharacterized protein n=1 Tax=Dorcoceras hygrometricum TaxID=472368 RepID=A0A2Z7CND4_9LAMI|nr:hypothetical protein F511_26371 [Dorcoceras hygrometricum]
MKTERIRSKLAQRTARISRTASGLECNSFHIKSVQCSVLKLRAHKLSDLTYSEQLKAHKLSDLAYSEHLITHKILDLAYNEKLRAQKLLDLAYSEQLRVYNIHIRREVVRLDQSN